MEVNSIIQSTVRIDVPFRRTYIQLVTLFQLFCILHAAVHPGSLTLLQIITPSRLPAPSIKRFFLFSRSHNAPLWQPLINKLMKIIAVTGASWLRTSNFARKGRKGKATSSFLHNNVRTPHYSIEAVHLTNAMKHFCTLICHADQFKNYYNGIKHIRCITCSEDASGDDSPSGRCLTFKATLESEFTTDVVLALTTTKPSDSLPKCDMFKACSIKNIIVYQSNRTEQLISAPNGILLPFC